MVTAAQQQLRGRPAHPPGPTSLAYTPTGKRLITAGSNNVIRVYTTGFDGEPTNIDDCQENNTCLVASNGFFISGSEDGRVCLYSLETFLFEKLITRSTLPIRGLALSPDGSWAAVASDEIEVKLVGTDDITKITYLRDHPKPVKHLSFHPGGSSIALSCTDGIIYIYNLDTEVPELTRKIDGVIRSLDIEAESSSLVAWHPDGTAFAAPTATRDIQVVSRVDDQRQGAFQGGHMGDITTLAWSPNGALLLSAGSDGRIILWDSNAQKILSRWDYSNVINISWHPYDNIVSFTTSEGELFIYEDFLTTDLIRLLNQPLQPAPSTRHLVPGTVSKEKVSINGAENRPETRKRRERTPDSLDDILGPDLDADQDDFVSDDDGAGYAEEINGFGKRTNGHLDTIDGLTIKRRAPNDFWRSQRHESFQPGSTPWRGDRRYLCLSLTGFVWTVDQETHNTVTVEFYDRDLYRDFHFTDSYSYDKACLSERGTLFSSPPKEGTPATIFYRPHETWTSRADWRTQLPIGENVISLSLSDSYVAVITSANYVRIFTLYGTPFRIRRQKSSPSVACASWGDYVLSMGNGPISWDGSTSLLYTIENIKQDEICQNEDVVALTEGAKIANVFFSDNGDPCIYDSTGVLLILQHWRTPGQARWVPILDTKLLDRLAGGRKEETYWPVAVAQDKFHCIILKGGDQYPYFPKPLLSEFDLQIPCSAPAKSDEREEPNMSEGSKLEELFVRSSLMLSLLEDRILATNNTHAQQAELGRQEVEVDKVLLQLLNVECREGEERGMKALEIVDMMKDRSGKMVEAAGKIAGRYGRTVLQEKIHELAERRLMGLDGNDT